MSNDVSENWYAHAFGQLYPIVYAHRTVDAARPEARFAAERLAISPTDRVLDLCCGNGRHMAHLTRHTCHLTGLDYSPDLLDLARQLLGHAIPLVRADMRAIPFQSAFDCITSFFTSFGYFFTHEENLRVAQQASHALKPNGRFFIDYLNPAAVRASLVPESRRLQQGYDIHESRWIDESSNRVNKKTVVTRDGHPVARWEESVRLYTLEQMTELLHAAHLNITNAFGDYDGSPIGDHQPRMILTGTKG